MQSMFALEIHFQDGVSQPETILIRRPQALIGASDYAHVVVDDMKELNFQIRLVRDLGRRFRCKPVVSAAGGAVPEFLEGVYDGFAAINLGRVRLLVTALDCDLMIRDGEPPDRAGVRALRQASSSPSPLFPAVVVKGSQPMIISFSPDQPVYIGRSKQCAVRLDAADVSARHARLGYENGEFWIEDLGSTNGTFVNQQQISGRVSVPAGVPVSVGPEISILGVTSEDQISGASQPQAARRPVQEERRYPILFSVSEAARPARLLLKVGVPSTIGRDPGCDMWLGAPHISRQHCRVTLGADGIISVVDNSTNGTGWDGGVLRKGEVLEVSDTPRVLDFGGGVTVAVCLGEEQEREFAAAQGSPQTFSGARETAPVSVEAASPVMIPSSAGNLKRSREEPPPERLSIGQRLRVAYGSAGKFGRLLLLSTLVAMAVVLIVVVNLLIPVFG